MKQSKNAILITKRVLLQIIMANNLNLEFGDKRDRKANWTDHEVISFLEILQEDEAMKDLKANRNKQVGRLLFLSFPFRQLFLQ